LKAQKLLPMGKVKLKQVKSKIGANQRQKDTLVALGLRRINQEVEHESTPQILGMVRKVNHLISVEYQ
jgi:large subunit ribosomal protein L30